LQAVSEAAQRVVAVTPAIHVRLLIICSLLFFLYLTLFTTIFLGCKINSIPINSAIRKHPKRENTLSKRQKLFLKYQRHFLKYQRRAPHCFNLHFICFKSFFMRFGSFLLLNERKKNYFCKRIIFAEDKVTLHTL